MIERIFVQLFMADDKALCIDRTLAMLEQSESFRPTHWSQIADLRVPYSRNAIDGYVASIRQGRQAELLHIKRVIPPRYRCVIKTNPSGPIPEDATWVHVASDLRLRPEDPELLSSLATDLARELDVEFGLVDLAFADAPQDRMNAGAHEHHGLFLERGPSKLYARTFLGRELTKRVGGLTLLSQCGTHASMLSETVCQVDLLPDPWAHSSGELKAAQSKALDCLRPSRVFRGAVGGVE
jgi:hypothetical protein